MFQVCVYKHKAAIYDTVARVYYFCDSMRQAKKRCAELNALAQNWNKGE